MLAYNLQARKYTDEEYLSKSDLVVRTSASELESIWKAVGEYREKYRFVLSIKRNDGIPFTICLTPALLSYSAECERRMLEFALRFEKLKTLEIFSQDKVLTKFKRNVEINDLLTIAKKYKLNHDYKDIELIINSNLNTDNLIYGVNEALLMMNDSKREISIQEMLRINNVLTKNNGFRKNELSFYPSCFKIEGMMNSLSEFADNTESLSCFVVASCLFGYYLYVTPFDIRTDLTGLLLSMKVLRNAGYGESVFYCGLIKRVFQTNRFSQALENTKLYGDLTYMFIAFCEEFLDAIDEQYDNLDKIDEPIPEDRKVQYIEKIVQIPVEKEVIKEVEKIVEVPVEVVKTSEFAYEDDPFKSNKVAKSKFKTDGLNMLPIVKENMTKTPQELAKALLEANPMMKFNQAHFYSTHHETGCYYTISQFKDFSGCVYETARTSMDYLVALNLYRKEQLKNKFVYLANEIEGD